MSPAWIRRRDVKRSPRNPRGRTYQVLYRPGGRGYRIEMAGIPVYSPHDLRHRRASLWHGQGVTVRELMDCGGWKRSEIAIDTYSHVMPLDEIDETQLELIAMSPPKTRRLS